MKKKKGPNKMVSAPIKKPNRTGKPFMVYFSDPVMDSWDAYMSTLDPRPSKKAMLETMIRQFLKEKGFWPPPESSTKVEE